MDEILTYRNAWNTSIEMMKDRGFAISPLYTQLTDLDFRHLVQENKIALFAENESQSKAMYVQFILAAKVKPSALKQIIDEIRERSEYDAADLELVFVLKVRPNNTVLKVEKDKAVTNVQIMWCKQLQFNITKHTLVPRHVRCTDEEADEMIRRYSLVNKMQLPVLLREDPVARYYNYKSGDIIRITNTSSSMNPNYEFYRVVK